MNLIRRWLCWHADAPDSALTFEFVCVKCGRRRRVRDVAEAENYCVRALYAPVIKALLAEVKP